MEIAKVSVSGVAATTVEATTIPAGIIGATIAVEYGPEWGGMIKNVSFRGAEDVTVVNVGNVVKLPQEVAAKPNVNIQIGFTGVSGEGAVLVPTLWADLGTTRPASPVNVEGGSTPPVWAQVVAMIGDLNMLKTPSKDNLVNAINDAADNAESAVPNSEQKSSMISFIDDDCRVETRTVLLPLTQNLGVPLAVACPPGNIGVTEGYMSVTQLQEMAAAGVTVSCHHWTQTNMNRYESAEAYAEDLDKCLAKFEEWGIRDVSSVCYPQGVYDDAFMKPVRERFKLGFGTFRGINKVPLESYYLRRCELFPQDGSFTIQQAKDMVDRVATEGGWLIFMTHAWYPTFSKEELLDLISYIKDKKVHIGSIDDGLNTFGNQAEAGAFHKPIESNAEPYFVKDASGQVWSKEYGAAELTLRTAKVISSTGPVVSVSSGDTEYVVSEKLDITGQDTVILSGWASDGNGLYVMYDADGNRKQVRYSAVSYAEGGEYMDNLVVPVPDGVTHIAVAGYFRKQMPGVIMQPIVPDSGQNVELDTTLTQSGKAADAKAVGDALAELEGKIPEDSGGVSDYTELTNKPSINGVELSGNKNNADLGISNPTNEQVAASVEAWLDAHPEATTTVADGSITEEKLTDRAVTIDKMSDFAFATDVRDYVQSSGGFPMFVFPLDGLSNTTVSIQAEIELLDSDGAIGFDLRSSESDSDTAYGTLHLSGTKRLDSETRTCVLTQTIDVTDKPYLTVMVANENKVCDFAIKSTVVCDGTVLDWTSAVSKWGDATVEKDKVFEMQERGVLATLDTAKRLAEGSLAEAKAYTDGSLAGYVYEIPDRSVTIGKLSDAAFELDSYSVVTVSNDDFAFLSFDISGIADRNGKTAEVQFFLTPLDENFIKMLNARAGTGDTTSQYTGMAFISGGATLVDEANKIYKVSGTYTIANDTHRFLNVYPQFSATAETQVKFFGVTVRVDGKRLEWVEAHRLNGGTVFPIVGVYQEGDRLLKLEHAEQLIAEAIGSVESSVNDTKDEVAQLKALIGDGMNTVVESPLNGKKWGVVGDSITFGTGTTDSSTTYHKYISEKYLMSISQKGIPGWCIALRPTYNDTLIDSVGDLPADCDYVTVFAGTNDYGNSIPIGTFQDTTNETFYGAVKLMCEALYERFGSKKFAFLTPTQRSGGNNPNAAGKTLKDYRDVIIEVSAYYGIPVLDLYAESGINPGLCGDFTGDGLHLNDAGHERISNRIAKFLESL